MEPAAINSSNSKLAKILTDLLFIILLSTPYAGSLLLRGLQVHQSLPLEGSLESAGAIVVLGASLIALGFVTAFLHYALDRAVFRLSDKEVRRAAHNLLE